MDEIRARLLRKVILSRTVEVPTPVDMVGTYLAGRRGNTPTRSFLLDLGGVCATGFSPEIVVSVDADRNVGTQPLAGTRALGGGEAADLSRRDDLLSDAKEIYEHAISVKVAYDELVPLCDPGTVMVTDYMSVKPRGSVQHLASSLVGGSRPASDRGTRSRRCSPRSPRRACPNRRRTARSGDTRRVRAGCTAARC